MPEYPVFEEKDSSSKWNYTLKEDWSLPIAKFSPIEFYSFATENNDENKTCREWLQVNNGELTIRKGYSSDGCSCSPDYETALPGCIAHDALRQAARIDIKIIN